MPESPRRAPLRVSTFHKVLQDIVVENLSSSGYMAQEEYVLDGVHVADVYATNEKRTVIVEVETGYVPPRFLSRAEDYLAARVLMKTLAYSRFADEFYIATPSFVRLPVPRAAVDCSGLHDGAGELLASFYGREALGRLSGGCRGLSGLMLVNIERRSLSLERFV